MISPKLALVAEVSVTFSPPSAGMGVSMAGVTSLEPAVSVNSAPTGWPPLVGQVPSLTFFSTCGWAVVEVVE